MLHPLCESVKVCRLGLADIIGQHLGGVVIYDRTDLDFVEIGAYVLPGVSGGDPLAESWATVSFTVFTRIKRVQVGASIVWRPINRYRGESRDSVPHGAPIGLISSGVIAFGLPLPDPQLSDADNNRQETDTIIRGIATAFTQARRAPRAMCLLNGDRL